MIEAKQIKKFLEKTPNAPGVYKFYDNEDRVIYIGKAKDLKKRLHQYFQKNYEHSYRTKKLLEKLFKIDFINVDSELESIILESNLIKQYKPKYNILLKDDKNYVYIKITRETFPRVQIVREIEKDNAKYIGPKTAAHKVKTTFQVLKKIFPFRHCGLNIQLLEEKPLQVKVTRKVIKYPCLDYYIKRCVAPCIAKTTVEEYQEIIRNVERFLEGKTDHVLKDLNTKMIEHAQKKEFEKAAKTRDKIEKIQDILEKQKVSDPNQEDKDVINYCIIQNRAYFNLFQIRDGKMIGQENFILSAEEIEENSTSEEVLEAFIKQYYELATSFPKEVLVPHTIENKSEIEKNLTQEKGSKVKLLIPQKGTKNQLLEMSSKNARIYADRQKPNWQQEGQFTKKAVEELQKILQMPKPLNRIECYDISHLSGTDTVGSMIVFEKGIPEKAHYRKFKLRSVQNKADDFKSMEEVLTRRFSKIALQIHHKDFKFKKKSNEDFELQKDKKTVGTITIKTHSTKVAELQNLWIDPEFRGEKLGYKILSEAIKKSANKRFYIVCKKELRDYYQLFGFEEIKLIPEELKGKEGDCLVYDKMKHKEDKSFQKIPDLVIIDGGKGQLSSAHEVFTKLDLEIPHISLAKRLEEIFLPNNSIPILLSHNNQALKLLQRARDEAHRFAITYNRKLRSKKFGK